MPAFDPRYLGEIKIYVGIGVEYFGSYFYFGDVGGEFFIICAYQLTLLLNCHFVYKSVSLEIYKN